MFYLMVLLNIFLKGRLFGDKFLAHSVLFLFMIIKMFFSKYLDYLKSFKTTQLSHPVSLKAYFKRTILYL